jgi:hypothetical protein
LKKFNQTILMQPIGSKTIGDSPFLLEVSATSGLSVSVIEDDDNISLEGIQVHLLKPGPATLTITQDGNENINAAAPLVETFCINPAKPTISVDFTNVEQPVLTSSAAENNHWFKNGQPMDHTGNILTVTEEGTYTVEVSAEGCISALSEAHMIITAVEEAQGEIMVYPNPARDFIQAHLPAVRAMTTFRILDLRGRLIHERHSNNEDIIFDLSAVASGIYIMTFNTNNKSGYRLFLKR